MTHVNQYKKWPESDLTYLEKNWPTMSGGKIAAYLGRTRNSVMGMANRLGLTAALKSSTVATLFCHRWSPSSARIARRAVVQKVGPKKKKKRVIKRPVPINGIPFLEVGYNQCRAVLGRTAQGVMVCGNPTDSHQSFCPTHREKYFTPAIRKGIHFHSRSDGAWR